MLNCPRRFLSSLLLLLFVPAGSFAGAPGSLDTSFNVGLGSYYGDNVVVVQPDGKVVIAGDFTTYHSVNRLGIARLNPDASLDLGFDPTNNVAGSPLHGVMAGSVLSNGKILVVGGFSQASGAVRNRAAQLNSDGSLDDSFDAGIGPNDDIQCMALQPDGKILIGGRFTSVAGQSKPYLTRLNSDGTVDTTFLGWADYIVESLALQPDGKIIVGGWFFHLDGTSPPNIARLNPDGTVDSGFVTSISSPVMAVSLQSDGKVLMGSSFSFSSGSSLARLRSNGSLDTFFKATTVSIKTICLQDDGKILIGGHFGSVNGASRSYLARLYGDGSTDTGFVSATDNEVTDFAFQADGRIIIAGGFAAVQGVSELGLARLYGDDRTATPVIELNGASFQGYQTDANVFIPVLRSGSTNNAVQVQYATADIDAQAGSDYVATSGTLTFAPGEVAKTMAVPLLNDGQAANAERFTFSLSSPLGGVLGTNVNATVSILGMNSMVQIGTPDIVTNELAGKLSISLTRVGTNIASSIICQTQEGTAKPGINYSNLTQNLSFAPGQVTATTTLTLLDDTNVGPTTSFSVVLTNPTSIQIGARSNLMVTLIDNDAPGHPGIGLNGNVLSVTPSADGAIMLGGSFISIDGVSRSRVGKVAADESLIQGFDPGAGFDASVQTMFAQPDGKSVCGGDFNSYNGVPRFRLARLGSDGALDASFDPGPGPSGSVYSIAQAVGSGYLVGGSFTNYAGAPRSGLAKINIDGSVDPNFLPQIPTVPGGRYYVYCIATQPSGAIYVGSDSLSGLNTNLCLRFNSDGSRDTTFTNSITGVPCFINSLAVQPDGKILIGGYFGRVNGVSRNCLARLNANGTLDASFNPGTGANSTIDKLILLSNSQIIAVGSFTTYAGVARKGIVRINSDGSIDPGFDPGPGADGAIIDVAPLAGNRWAIGGAFRSFARLPRYGFAVLGSNGQVITRSYFESFSVSDSLSFGIRVEPEVPFQLLSSSNLTSWQVIYSNLFHQGFTNLVLPAVVSERQFFKALQVP